MYPSEYASRGAEETGKHLSTTVVLPPQQIPRGLDIERCVQPLKTLNSLCELGQGHGLSSTSYFRSFHGKPYWAKDASEARQNGNTVDLTFLKWLGPMPSYHKRTHAGVTLLLEDRRPSYSCCAVRQVVVPVLVPGGCSGTDPHSPRSRAVLRVRKFSDLYLAPPLPPLRHPPRFDRQPRPWKPLQRAGHGHSYVSCAGVLQSSHFANLRR